MVLKFKVGKTKYKMGKYIQENHESENFKLIRPVDGSDNFDGAFPCGRKPGFHGKEIKLPLDLICESCVLQLT